MNCRGLLASLAAFLAGWRHRRWVKRIQKERERWSALIGPPLVFDKDGCVVDGWARQVPERMVEWARCGNDWFACGEYGTIVTSPDGVEWD